MFDRDCLVSIADTIGSSLSFYKDVASTSQQSLGLHLATKTGSQKMIARGLLEKQTWVVVKILFLFGVPIIIRHLIFRAPKKGP